MKKVVKTTSIKKSFELVGFEPDAHQPCKFERKYREKKVVGP
jgi:hypothetical protein